MIYVTRGMHSRIIILPEEHLVIKVYPKELLKNAFKEYSFLNFLWNKRVNVPKPYALFFREQPILLREYITGIHFIQYVKEKSPKEIVKVLDSLLRLAHMLDIYGIFIDEISFPTKNILINARSEVFLIDFERAVYNPGRSNVTQILGYLFSSAKSGGFIGRKLRNYVQWKKFPEVARKYKRTRDIEMVVNLLYSWG